MTKIHYSVAAELTPKLRSGVRPACGQTRWMPRRGGFAPAVVTSDQARLTCERCKSLTTPPSVLS